MKVLGKYLFFTLTPFNGTDRQQAEHQKIIINYPVAQISTPTNSNERISDNEPYSQIPLIAYPKFWPAISRYLIILLYNVHRFVEKSNTSVTA